MSAATASNPPTAIRSNNVIFYSQLYFCSVGISRSSRLEKTYKCLWEFPDTFDTLGNNEIGILFNIFQIHSSVLSLIHFLSLVPSLGFLIAALVRG